MGDAAKNGPGVGGAESPTTLKGVHRALQVIEYIAEHPGRASELAEGLGISWATMHRTLSALEKTGFLERDTESNRYHIGPRMWFIGSTYLARHPVLQVAHPYLSELAMRCDGSVQLVERLGRQAVTLYAHTASGEVITKSTYGHHFPLHCGSKGQALLAFEAPAFVEDYLNGPLETLTAETITDPNELRDRLADIRTAGFAVTAGDVQPFTGSLSAPVFDRSGKVVAAVCIIVRRAVLEDEKQAAELQDRVQNAAQSTSIALGWAPRPVTRAG